jgi:hypothetical protein
MFHINATSSLSFRSNKKACSQPRKQAIILQATLEEHRFFGNPAILSQRDGPAERIRGFVSPGSPEFTLSETLHLYCFKERFAELLL